MKTKNKLPFISLLIIATIALTPFIVAIDGGSVGGFDAGGFSGGSVGGFDAGGFSGGSVGGFDASGFNDPVDVGGFDTPVVDTTVVDTSVTDTGSFDSGIPGAFDGLPPLGPGEFPPGGFPPGGPGGFPTNVDAVWQSLSDVSIQQASTSGTIIQENIFSKCTDVDADSLRFDIVGSSNNFRLAFVNDDLKIFDLDPFFVGTETVTLACNNVAESFLLTVTPFSSSVIPEMDSETSKLSVHIGSIIITNAYDAEAGDIVPVRIAFKNNGDTRLENLKAAVVIQDLNLRASVGPLEDLPIGKKVSRTMYFELPKDVQPGTYYVRITIDSGSVHRVVHREIDVTY